MSGVYIKGFPLPNNCGACPLRLAWCRERIYMVARPERCPLVPVPPHGDLIDRDATRESIKPWVPEDERNCCTFDTAKKLMHTLLNRAPTIIPADLEKEK